MTKQETFKNLETIVAPTVDYLKNLGYEVNVVSSEIKFVIYIRSNEKFLPDLYFHSKDVFDFAQQDGEWTLQTTSYGTLVGEELKDYMNGIINGVNAVRELNRFQSIKDSILSKLD